MVLTLLAVLWRGLLMSTIHEELAWKVFRWSPVALCDVLAGDCGRQKIVGVLLITALLVIPAATARRLAKNPEHMMALAVVFGFIAVAGGLSMSWYLDSPAGPSVVVTAFLSFLLVYGAARKNSH